MIDVINNPEGTILGAATAKETNAQKAARLDMLEKQANETALAQQERSIGRQEGAAGLAAAIEAQRIEDMRIAQAQAQRQAQLRPANYGLAEYLNKRRVNG